MSNPCNVDFLLELGAPKSESVRANEGTGLNLSDMVLSVSIFLLVDSVSLIEF